MVDFPSFVVDLGAQFFKLLFDGQHKAVFGFEMRVYVVVYELVCVHELGVFEHGCLILGPLLFPDIEVRVGSRKVV